MKGRKRKNYLVFKENGVGKRTLYGSFSSRKRAENAVLLDTAASNGDCPSSGVVLLEKGKMHFRCLWKMNGRPALGYESEKGHGERFPPPCGLPMNVSLLLLLRSALTVCKDYFGDGAGLLSREFYTGVIDERPVVEKHVVGRYLESSHRADKSPCRAVHGSFQLFTIVIREEILHLPYIALGRVDRVALREGRPEAPRAFELLGNRRVDFLQVVHPVDKHLTIGNLDRNRGAPLVLFLGQGNLIETLEQLQVGQYIDWKIDGLEDGHAAFSFLSTGFLFVGFHTQK